MQNNSKHILMYICAYFFTSNSLWACDLWNPLHHKNWIPSGVIIYLFFKKFSLFQVTNEIRKMANLMLGRIVKYFDDPEGE